MQWCSCIALTKNLFVWTVGFEKNVKAGGIPERGDPSFVTTKSAWFLVWMTGRGVLSIIRYFELRMGRIERNREQCMAWTIIRDQVNAGL